MKLHCYHCKDEVDILIELKGPHLKASCIECRKYIKFLNHDEKLQLEEEEDAKQ